MDFSHTAVLNHEVFWPIKHCVSGETMVVVRGEVACRMDTCSLPLPRAGLPFSIDQVIYASFSSTERVVVLL